SLLLPLMLLSRLSQRNKSQNYDPLTEFRISKFLNFFLEKILDFERLFVKLGCTFPLGGSLLVIAYKK
ncbi:MAG: SAM-dependent methyltransferase, partial [Pseudanabaenaceae cyanobacterium]